MLSSSTFSGHARCNPVQTHILADEDARHQQDQGCEQFGSAPSAQRLEHLQQFIAPSTWLPRVIFSSIVIMVIRCSEIPERDWTPRVHSGVGLEEQEHFYAGDNNCYRPCFELVLTTPAAASQDRIQPTETLLNSQGSPGIRGVNKRSMQTSCFKGGFVGESEICPAQSAQFVG
jgi:hypothetical protein